MTNRTYRYFKGKPLFAFGYGLSYTSFSFGKPAYKDGKLTVSVTNTGKMKGTEVVQAYVKDPADTQGPAMTLRGFERVTLNPGEKKRVTINMPRERFSLWDKNSNTMRVKPGRHLIFIGNSSRPEDLQKIDVDIK